MSNQIGFTGVAFPFRFSGGGGVAKSTTSAEDFSHIKEEIIQVICTNLGERVFRPDYGSELSKATYDNKDITTVSLIQSYVRDALKVLDEVIEVLDIEITDGKEEGILIVSVDIYVKKIGRAHV